MKRQNIIIATTSIIILSVLGSLFLSGCTIAGINFGGISYQTENIDKLGLKVDKPKQWPVAKIDSTNNYVDYVINIPEGNQEGGGIAGWLSINLAKPLAGEKVSIDDEVNGLKKLFSNNITEMKVLEEGDTKLMNLPAKKVVIQFRNNEDKTILEKAVFTVTIKDNSAYVVLMDDDTKDFEKNLPIYDKIAASVQAL